ncbi:MAG: hypothetical protein AAGF79_15375 [Pseudomonadota bacterium]
MPEQRRPLLLHVGYHKTATTWLQNIVFTPQNYFVQMLSHAEVFEQILNPHGLQFDPSVARATFKAHLGTAPEHAEVDVVSLESITGLPFTGGRESDDYARRLKQIFLDDPDGEAPPRVTVLLTIREQFAIIASVYMQYLMRAGTERPERFLDETPYPGYPTFSAENFCYHRLVGLYQDLFGAENVLVLPQELIAADQPAAVALMADVSGNDRLREALWAPRTERGNSYPQYAAPLLRRANFFRRDAMNPAPVLNLGRAPFKLVGGLSRRVPLPASLKRSKPLTDLARQTFAGRFANSNRALQAMLAHKVDLSGYEGL